MRGRTPITPNRALVPLLSLAALILVAGCKDSVGPWEIKDRQDFSHQIVWQLAVEPPASSLQAGDEVRLEACWKNEDAGLTRPLGPTEEVEWESENSKVASVTEDGQVVAHGPGEVTITATQMIRTSWGYRYAGEKATAAVAVN